LNTFEHWRRRVVGRFRDATIDGGEMTLWVINVTSSASHALPLLPRLRTYRWRRAAQRPTGLTKDEALRGKLRQAAGTAAPLVEVSLLTQP
jgi:hypothetical protein